MMNLRDHINIYYEYKKFERFINVNNKIKKLT